MSLWKKYVRWKELLVFASGMAAVYSMAALLNSGDHIVSSVVFWRHSLFINYFPKWNIQTYFDINKPETIDFITPNTKILLLNRQQIQQLIL
jgi:O-succinylhomoserine sulfhydrylase